MMTNRVLVGDEHGLNFTYESASTWDELVQVLTLKRWAEEAGWAQLALGIQCTLGLETYDGVLRSATGRLRIPESWERFRGRHIVVPIGWEPTTNEVLFLNSWGRNWGDHGFGYVGREFFEAHVDSVNLTRPAWLGFSPRDGAGGSRWGSVLPELRGTEPRGIPGVLEDGQPYGQAPPPPKWGDVRDSAP